MIYYVPEGHGCAYSIDTEGTLFYIPIVEGGALYFDEIAEVDYDNVDGCCYEPEVKDIFDIHQKLIQMSKIAGIYYQP
jgi:hypothetical protein